ncbi:glycosyltransferase family 39 protein [Pontibacter vulgaris]|uniref:glycosyltransferase family 39 protein n=1 Tax=Pontibacter vulgaris TaxID=2905679 RepID=UPI001FA7DEAD|nr:glycosyltransferase family 39 protein [Pontibacter vulgaris]
MQQPQSEVNYNQHRQQISAHPAQPAEVKPMPLGVILTIALAIRLLAAVFSKGYAFSDDHFDVIKIAQNWLYDLPYWLNTDMPPRHSMFYTGLHYFIFYTLEAAGINSPDTKMLVIRLLHAFYSLLIVYFGYKITELLSSKTNARLAGLMLALIWFMPFMSVRNLVEMVCIPPYLAAFYLMLKYEKQALNNWKWLLPGALFALAFVLRYHTALFVAGAGFVLLYRRQWAQLAWLSFGFILVAFLIQGTIDIIFFDYPFHSIITYFFYNAENAYGFNTGPAYRFLLTVLGFLVPPISVFLLMGYARTRRLAPMLFWAGLLFFVVHSLFPNKQERFIFPLLPLIVILGVTGWQSYVQHSPFWLKHRRWLAYSWRFFWVLNIAAAIGLSLTYSKKSRVAPLVYLSDKENVEAIVLETGEGGVKNPPLFYLGHMSATYQEYQDDNYQAWAKYKNGQPLPHNFIMVYTLDENTTLAKLQQQIAQMKRKPTYVVMAGNKNLEQRLARLRKLYPALTLETSIKPSLYDQVLQRLNPGVHKDESVQIYRIGKK